MSYERKKEFTAVLSILSVLVTVLASVATTLVYDGFDEQSFTYFTAVASIVAAIAATISITASRKLNFERERRKVFLVYAREDLAAAKELSTMLDKKGFSTWLDVERILPGQIWHKAVLQGIEESAVALVLVSKHLEKKGFVHKEVKVALEALQERNKDVSPVIPVRLDDSPVPGYLTHIHWVSLEEENGFDQLVSGLKWAAA